MGCWWCQNTPTPFFFFFFSDVLLHLIITRHLEQVEQDVERLFPNPDHEG